MTDHNNPNEKMLLQDTNPTNTSTTSNIYPPLQNLNLENVSISNQIPHTSNQPNQLLGTIRDIKALQNMLNTTFTGNPLDLRAFLDDVSLTYNVCHPDYHDILLQIIIHNRIRGEPRERIRECDNPFTIESLKKFLRDHYEPKETFSQAHAKLSSLIQKPNETVRQYADRINEHVYKARIAAQREDSADEKAISLAITSRTAKERFLVGSKIEISRYLRGLPRQLGLSELIHEAEEFEQTEIQEITNRRLYHHESRLNNSGRYCSFCKTTTHNTADCRSKNRSHTSRSNECAYCHIPGHTKEECRKKRNDEMKKTPTTHQYINALECKFCKKPGHTIEKCRKLEYRKKTEPEKYDRSHPNYQGPQNTQQKKETPKNESKRENSEFKQIHTCSTKIRAIVELPSPHATSDGKFQLLVDDGAEISILKYETLTPEKIKEIDRTRTIPFGGITLDFGRCPHLWKSRNTCTFWKTPIRIRISRHSSKRASEYEFRRNIWKKFA